MRIPEKGTQVVSTLGNIKRIHFVGVGGTGMSGIAEVLLNLGCQANGNGYRERYCDLARRWYEQNCPC